MKLICIIIFLQICCVFASHAQIKIDTTVQISIEEIKELEPKLESEDPTFRFEFLEKKDVSFFLEAQKLSPQNFIWIDLINMHFAGEKYNAIQLVNENERTILFENALKYLTESREILENVQLVESNDSIKKVYNFYLRLLEDDIAFAAFGAGKLEMAEQLAEEMLLNNVDTLSFNYGNTIHNANTILGRVALKKDNLTRAKECLIKSLESPVSPQLKSFGPSYILAKELLVKGEMEIVLDYLDLVANFWANPEHINSSDTRMMAGNQRKIELLKKWKEEIKSGKIPNDPRW